MCTYIGFTSPGGQATQLVLSIVLVSPTPQSEHSVAPAAENFPSGQKWHSRPEMAKVPAAHFSHVAEPLVEIIPFGQSRQFTPPEDG